MNYIHTTRESFRNKVRQKLGEDGVHWTNNELNLSIDEALLTFGAVSGFWKEKIFLRTQENKIIYDLFSDTEIGNTFIEPSIKYKDIFDWLNKDLLESVTFATPITEFLEVDTYIKAIESKYNLYQQLTNLICYNYSDLWPAERIILELPENLIDIIRITFTTESGQEIILDEADEQEIYQNDFSPLVDTLDEVPRYYSTVYGLTKDLRIYPTPANTGTIKIIFIGGIKSVPIVDEEIKLLLPNNLTPYIKFGVEADIFSNEGVFNDPVRAAYCKQRWEEGIIIGRNYTSALVGRINDGKILDLDSMNNVDIYSDNIKSRRPPNVLGFGGFNIFRTDVIPSAVEYVINLTTNSNAKLPENDVDFIEIDLEYIDMLADYVVHLAKFRNGAYEVATTNNLKDNFLKVSVNHNRRLMQAGITFENLIGATKKQEKEQPRIAIETV